MQRHYDRLADFAERLAGVDRLLASWSAQDYETPDQLPYIGRLPGRSRIFFAAGFGKWGLSNGTLAGRLLAALITEGHSRFETLFSLKRADFLHAPGKAAAENLASVSELVGSQCEQPERLRKLRRGEGRIVEYKGKKAGAFRDDDDQVTILDIHCTHMKTVLRFNAAERTWDCPAHGGRFDTDGLPLEGPPRKPLKIYFKGPYADLPQ
jgi:Rieske Fe-S protein